MATKCSHCGGNIKYKDDKWWMCLDCEMHGCDLSVDQLLKKDEESEEIFNEKIIVYKSSRQSNMPHYIQDMDIRLSSLFVLLNNYATDNDLCKYTIRDAINKIKQLKTNLKVINNIISF